MPGRCYCGLPHLAVHIGALCERALVIPVLFRVHRTVAGALPALHDGCKPIINGQQIPVPNPDYDLAGSNRPANILLQNRDVFKPCFGTAEVAGSAQQKRRAPAVDEVSTILRTVSLHLIAADRTFLVPLTAGSTRSRWGSAVPLQKSQAAH